VARGDIPCIADVGQLLRGGQHGLLCRIFGRSTCSLPAMAFATSYCVVLRDHGSRRKRDWPCRLCSDHRRHSLPRYDYRLRVLDHRTVAHPVTLAVLAARFSTPRLFFECARSASASPPDRETPPVIREFQAGDQGAFREVVQAGLRERWGEAFDPNFNADLDDITANYVVAKRALVVVLIIDDTVAGTGILIPEGRNLMRIVRMSVEHHQRRKGHAAAIVRDLVKRASDLGAQRVLVKTDTAWVEAVALYRSCGFAIVREDNEATDFELILPQPTDQRATSGEPKLPAL
jgi:GNAT superfamily N-acetyltransferase